MKTPLSFGLIWVFGLALLWSCGGENKALKLALTIENWTYEFAPAVESEVPVQVYCIGDQGWSGEIELRIQQPDSVLGRWHNGVEILPDSSTTIVFQIQLPKGEGKYELVSELIHPDGRSIRNRRLIKVKKPLDLSL